MPIDNNIPFSNATMSSVTRRARTGRRLSQLDATAEPVNTTVWLGETRVYAHTRRERIYGPAGSEYVNRSVVSVPLDITVSNGDMLTYTKDNGSTNTVEVGDVAEAELWSNTVYIILR
jgi:hypothetical protein